MDFGSPSAGRRRRGILILGVAGGVLVVGVALVASTLRPSPVITPTIPAGPTPPSVAALGWIATSDGDFQAKEVSVADSRLRLRASTSGKRPDTTKFLGVRRRDPVALTPGTRVSVDIDWNRQANGSGLSAGIVLSPESTDANPYQLASGIWVEYKGVPPGQNARRVIGRRHDSAHHHLDMDGWPERKGRPIGVQKLEIEIGAGGSFKVVENGTAVYESGPGVLEFDRAYVYLQLTSAANYPSREVYFGNFAVSGSK